MKNLLLAAAASAALIATPAAAQSSSTSVGDRIGQILGTIFGTGTTANTSLDAQWRAGRRPLSDQRAQFDSRVDAEVRSGVLTSAMGVQLKRDYFTLVDLEWRYGQDGQFSAAERQELANRYSALTQALNSGGDYVYDRNDDDAVEEERYYVRDGRAEFDRRVDNAVATRRVTRAAGRRLKADYAALITTESNYLRDGVLSSYERDDLDSRLDRLEDRIGDGAGGVGAVLTPRARLDAILRALPSAGLTTTARARLLVEHGDLLRLEAAYARLTPTTEERAYLERRLADLELRARVSR